MEQKEDIRLLMFRLKRSGHLSLSTVVTVCNLLKNNNKLSISLAKSMIESWIEYDNWIEPEMIQSIEEHRQELINIADMHFEKNIKQKQHRKRKLESTSKVEDHDVQNSLTPDISLNHFGQLTRSVSTNVPPTVTDDYNDNDEDGTQSNDDSPFEQSPIIVLHSSRRCWPFLRLSRSCKYLKDEAPEVLTLQYRSISKAYRSSKSSESSDVYPTITLFKKTLTLFKKTITNLSTHVIGYGFCICPKHQSDCEYTIQTNKTSLEWKRMKDNVEIQLIGENWSSKWIPLTIRRKTTKLNQPNHPQIANNDPYEKKKT
jgi:hypothetical protein